MVSMIIVLMVRLFRDDNDVDDDGGDVHDGGGDDVSYDHVEDYDVGDGDERLVMMRMVVVRVIRNEVVDDDFVDGDNDSGDIDDGGDEGDTG